MYEYLNISTVHVLSGGKPRWYGDIDGLWFS